MKRIFAIIILLALGGTALWWFTRPVVEASASAKVAETPVAPKSIASAPVPKPVQVEAPNVAPVNRRVPSPEVYPTAPRMSALIAAARANSSESGGMVVIPSVDAIRNQYGNLMQKMRFTPAQAEAFVEILADKQDQEAAIMQANPMKNPQSGPRTEAEIAMAFDQYQQQLQSQEQPVEQNAAAQLRQLLGNDDNYDYYRTYTDQNKERMIVVNGYADNLDSAGVLPLTLAQEEQLVNLVYQGRVSANDDPAVQAQQVPQILQQAAAFLSADQIGVLKRAMPDLIAPVIHGASG